jgi:aminoglycoside-2''-adenylyltransferase
MSVGDSCPSSRGDAPIWRRAIGELPDFASHRWAIGGSAALALHGLPVDPRDIDLVGDADAAADFASQLANKVDADEQPWERGRYRATRRLHALVAGVDVEILVGIEARSVDGQIIQAPDLSSVDYVLVESRLVPVIKLATMLAVMEATDQRERASLVRQALTSSSPAAAGAPFRERPPGL